MDGAIDGTAIQIELQGEYPDAFSSLLGIASKSEQNDHDHSLNLKVYTLAIIKIIVIM
jgi:hypothetical protein